MLCRWPCSFAVDGRSRRILVVHRFYAPTTAYANACVRNEHMLPHLCQRKAPALYAQTRRAWSRSNRRGNCTPWSTGKRIGWQWQLCPRIRVGATGSTLISLIIERKFFPICYNSQRVRRLGGLGHVSPACRKVDPARLRTRSDATLQPEQCLYIHVRNMATWRPPVTTVGQSY